ncbi:MAG: hypothetical protein AAGE52_34025 [Myxococcota bacterium]
MKTPLCLSLLMILACGDDDRPGGMDSGPGTDSAVADTSVADTAVADTAVADTAVGEDAGDVMNFLGQVCGEGLPECPAEHTCTITPLPMGSTTQGYCSPNCATTDDCTNGYAGPGRPSCFFAPQCAISCDVPMGAGQCPEGLTCLPTGGPTSACGVAM